MAPYVDFYPSTVEEVLLYYTRTEPFFYWITLKKNIKTRGGGSKRKVDRAAILYIDKGAYFSNTPICYSNTPSNTYPNITAKSRVFRI